MNHCQRAYSFTRSTKNNHRIRKHVTNFKIPPSTANTHTHTHTHTPLLCGRYECMVSNTVFHAQKNKKRIGRKTKCTITLLEITIFSNHGKVNVQAKGIIALDTWNGEPMKSPEFQTTNHIPPYCTQYIQLCLVFFEVFLTVWQIDYLDIFRWHYNKVLTTQQSQQCKHQSNVWNLFKVNNTGTRTISLASF